MLQEGRFKHRLYAGYHVMSIAKKGENLHCRIFLPKSL